MNIESIRKLRELAEAAAQGDQPQEARSRCQADFYNEFGLPQARAVLALAEQQLDSFQQRVQPWMLATFGEMISGDREERNHRFLEESLELVQACGCTASEARQLVDYVFGRPTGEPAQEVGGVMVTLAALCLANELDMHATGETELARIWTKVEAIRAKQAAKPKHSPLPQASQPVPQPAPVVWQEPIGYAPTYLAERLAAGDAGVMLTVTRKPLPGHGVTVALYTTPVPASSVQPKPEAERDAALELPELESLVDLAYSINTPEDWDEDYRSIWQQLQVAKRNLTKWAMFGKSYRALAAHPAASVAQEAAQQGQPCDGCNGHGMIGGLLPGDGGYDSRECHFCKGSGKDEVPQGERDKHGIANRLAMWLSASMEQHADCDVMRTHIRAWLDSQPPAPAAPAAHPIPPRAQALCNDGAERDYTELDCPACGGSGHAGDAETGSTP